VLVHVPTAEDLPADLVAIPADLPDDVRVEHVRVEELSRDWRRTPAPTALAEHGTAWLAAARTAVLAVPSAVVPVETNYLLNPLHPDFPRIAVGDPEPFRLDARLAPRARSATVIPLRKSPGPR
jgi:RES domain-containing protein